MKLLQVVFAVGFIVAVYVLFSDKDTTKGSVSELESYINNQN